MWGGVGGGGETPNFQSDAFTPPPLIPPHKGEGKALNRFIGQTLGRCEAPSRRIVQCSMEAPSCPDMVRDLETDCWRNPLRMRAWGDERSLLHPLSRHGRPCAGHPRLRSRSGSQDVDHRHKAGDDGVAMVRRTLCSHFVLDRARKLSYIVGHPRPTRGALREALLSVGAGSGPARRITQPADRRPLAAVRWSKSKRLKIPRARRRPALPLKS